jgi:hypothetical protein
LSVARQPRKVSGKSVPSGTELVRVFLPTTDFARAVAF